MDALSSCLHTASRERIVGLAIAAVIGVAVLVPSSAHATGCTDSWTNTKGGSWFEGSNWSKKAPPTSEEEACITENGTYTVEMTETSTTGTVSVKALTIGGSSGTQTLVVGSSSSLNATLATTAGIGIGKQGAITMTNGDSSGNSVTLSGPISNAGTLTSEPAHGGARTLQGNLTNTGTLQINANTAYSGLSAAISNEGALDIAEGKVLTVSEKGSVTNGSGGKIAATGSGEVLLDSGTSFNEGAGTTSGTKPVIVDDASLTYSGAGASAIALHGESTLSGTSSSGQSLSIESTGGENAKTTAATGFTNGGSITLTNGDSSGNSATLVISSGTLKNSGTITSELAIGGTRTLQGNVTNTGTLQINANTAYSGLSAALSNEGALDIAEGKVLTVSEKGSLTNGTGGKIAATGSGDVLMSSGTSFSEGAGTTSGTKPVIVDDASLTYSGAGTSAIALHGESTLSGNLSSGQSLSIESTGGENAKTTAAAGFKNGGSITLTNGDSSGNNATLVISAGALLNSGTITTEVAHGGTRTLQGDVTNTGTLQINANTAYSTTGAILVNEGAIDVANGVALSASSAPTISNESGGTIAGTGTGALVQTGGTFNEGLGKTTGSVPVIVDDGALHYTNKGSSTLALRGTSTLSGAISAGQTLSIQSTSSENATATAAGGFLNSGTIDLTNGDGAGNNATLVIGGAGTLENKGTINVEIPHGGTRTIEGSLKNEKTVSLAAGQPLRVTGSYTQGKKATLKTAIAGSSSFGALSVTGTATLGGTLALSQSKTFLGKAGESFAILSSSSRTGSFAKESKATIKKTVGLYYKPTYPATGVTLVVTQAKLVLSKNEGAPGSSATLSGTGYPGEDTIKLTFTDHAKHKTTLSSVKTNAGGEFSTEVTVPPGAAEGAASFSAKSTIAAVSSTAAYTVT
jgi:hypothetical protein